VNIFKNAEWSVLKGFQDFADLKAKVHEYDNAEVEVETLKLVAPFPILPPPLPSAASDSPSAAPSAASPAAGGGDGGGDSDAGGCVRRSEKEEEEEEAEAEAERQRKLLNDYVRELSTKMVLLPRMLQIEVCSKAN
jgi:hypothetical protein